MRPNRLGIGVNNLESSSDEVEEAFLRRWQSFERLKRRRGRNFDLLGDNFLLGLIGAKQQREKVNRVVGILLGLIIAALTDLSRELQRAAAVVARRTAVAFLWYGRNAAFDERRALLCYAFAESFDAVAHLARSVAVARQLFALLVEFSTLKAAWNVLD